MTRKSAGVWGNYDHDKGACRVMQRLINPPRRGITDAVPVEWGEASLDLGRWVRLGQEFHATRSRVSPVTCLGSSIRSRFNTSLSRRSVRRSSPRRSARATLSPRCSTRRSSIPGWGRAGRARETAAPVLLPDLRNGAVSAWPLFLATATRHGISSAYAFPMVVGPAGGRGRESLRHPRPRPVGRTGR